MEADWEVEIGGDAHVVEPDWPGFVDLRTTPEAAEQLPEAAALPGLAQSLARMNAKDSPVWTAKCDVWDLDGVDSRELDATDAEAHAGAACYVDLLPCERKCWAAHKDAAEWCGQVCERLGAIALRSCRVDLVVRATESAAERAGFAVTAYASAAGVDGARARQRLAETLAVLADTLIQMSASGETAKRLQ
ncbi:MAG: hypothetical protein WBD67_00050 [Terracidiphilus sp.]